MQKSQFIEIKQKIKCSTNLFDDNKSFEKIFFALILPIQNKLRAKFVFFWGKQICNFMETHFLSNQASPLMTPST